MSAIKPILFSWKRTSTSLNWLLKSGAVERLSFKLVPQYLSDASYTSITLDFLGWVTGKTGSHQIVHLQAQPLCDQHAKLSQLPLCTAIVFQAERIAYAMYFWSNDTLVLCCLIERVAWVKWQWNLYVTMRCNFNIWKENLQEPPIFPRKTWHIIISTLLKSFHS